MKRTFLALWAVVAMFGYGAGSAHAFVSGTGDWLSHAFRGEERAVSSSQRRAGRATRANRAADISESRAQTRRSRSAAALPSLTGGSSYQSGVASYYWQPQRVASGGWFNPNAMTAAHKTLPFGTRVRVTNLNNGRSTTVTINDRGPYIAGRVIDLSRAAAGAVGMQGAGVARVSLAIVGR